MSWDSSKRCQEHALGMQSNQKWRKLVRVLQDVYKLPRGQVREDQSDVENTGIPQPREPAEAPFPGGH